jgi:hypothetical protein
VPASGKDPDQRRIPEQHRRDPFHLVPGPLAPAQ